MFADWCVSLARRRLCLGPSGLSTEDSRRISFHIRFNRPSSLFARCWLLVEGETETSLSMNWRVSADIILMPKGSRSLSLPSRAKATADFARRMGIEWTYWSMAMKQGRNMPLRYAAC
ncbi:DUF2813 domain-containing protein [Shigella flexneri]